MTNRRMRSVFCPACEKKLLRVGTTDGMDLKCPRCNIDLEIECYNNVLTVREATVPYEAVKSKRAEAI